MNNILQEKEKQKEREKEKVRVVVRCRPLSYKERKSGFHGIVEINPRTGSVQIFNPQLDGVAEGKMFTFDAVYDWNATQKELYEQSVEMIVGSVLKGFNGTIFAYGQTGTGKTFTMDGEEGDKGVIPRALNQIFNHIARSRNTQYLVRASYLEIYQDEVKDLLDINAKKSYGLAGNESGIYIKNLKSHVCKNAAEMERVMRVGNRNRKVGRTDMNDHSSRSHAIFIVTVEMSRIKCGVNQVRVGKLNLVDLAGSEKQSKSRACGVRLKEASKINLSLSALGNVIAALSNGKKFHVPYRDSKLTRLLQDSLGGNSKTLMIANIGPASYNYDETLTTLRYANRAKNIKNRPWVNEDPKDALIREYQNEILRLKEQLETKIQDRSKSIELEILERRSLCDDEKEMRILVAQQHEKECALLAEKKKENQILKAKIELIESKLLCGENMEQELHENEQTVLLKTAEQIRESSTRLRQELGKQEEAVEELQESNSHLQLEVERKMSKVNRALMKLHSIAKHTNDFLEEFNRDRREVEEVQYNLLKEYKLNQLIIENFIPLQERRKLYSIARYDQDNERWHFVKNKNKNNRQHDQIDNEYRKEIMKPGSRIRRNSENIATLTPTMLTCNTKKYHSPNVSPTIKCHVANALTAEEDMNIDAAYFTKHNCSPYMPVKVNSIKTAAPVQCRLDYCPKPRGLVKK